jgi:prefoldin alpha subunit
MEDKHAREKIVEFQLLQQQLEQMQKHNEELKSKLAEFHKTKMTLKEMKEIKNGTELFVPIAQGIFTKVKMHDSELLVNVGANTTVKKNIPHVIKLIDQQLKDVKEIKEKMDDNAAKVTKRLHKLAEEIQSL